jgi:hypothetical protein
VASQKPCGARERPIGVGHHNAHWGSSHSTAIARKLLAKNKKADVVERPEAFDHVGLLVNEPPGTAELPFI